VENVLKDGTLALNRTGVINVDVAKDINFIGGYDGSATDPISLAEYWIYTYAASAGRGAAWVQKFSSGTIPSTDGFIFKGPGRAQNYTFAGIPKDGIITTTIGSSESYLVGNPYPSAISVKEFIEDNIDAIEGTLYFWQHASEQNSSGINGHFFAGYIGGYATRNIAMGVSYLAAATGAVNTNLQAEAAIFTGLDVTTIDNALDVVQDVSAVLLNDVSESITFRSIPAGIDTLRIRHKNLTSKVLSLKVDGIEKGTLTFDGDNGDLFETSEFVICIESGSTIVLTSNDDTDIYLDYINIKDDGNISCAPNAVFVEDYDYKEPAAYIAVGQGFFVGGDDDGGTITFNNSQREYVDETSGESVFLKSSNTKEKSSSSTLPILKLGMDFTNTDDIKLHRQIGISFNEFNSFAFENGYDSHIFDLASTDMYWNFPEIDGNLVIAGVQEISETLEVPFDVIIGNEGSISFSVDEAENINYHIYVTDKFTEISYDISEQNSAIFLEEGTYSDRFMLTFKEIENSDVLSTDDNILTDKLSIYPDNTNELLVITNADDVVINSIELYNTIGKSIQYWSTIENDGKLKLIKNIPSGFYIVRMTTNEGVISKKIILE
ncbi:T9SS type A sorting domain-containing protein, partial [Polaribacter sp.]|nr:T9SS type A sorting domain-containing protein [Polaribacter sp.]